MKKELENAKTALTGDVVELDSQMSEVSNDLLEVQNLLDTKEAELEKTTKELAQAKIDVEKQYEDMKLRIKFMYENGTMSYIQILLSSGSFSELLNKAEYIEQVSEYDRNMLQTYQDNRDKITRLEKDLKDQKEVLEQVKGDVEAKQTEMAGLISDKQTEIEGYESDIQNKEEAIKEFDAIKEKFNDINTTLLKKWKGEGKDAYKKESDHIMENIGGIKDILDSINNGVVKDTKDAYLQLDEELGEFNKNPQTAEGE